MRALLDGRTALSLERRTADFVWPSLDGMMAGYEQQFGPIVLAGRALEPARYEALKDDLRALVEEFDTGGREVRLPAEYLLVVGRKP